MPVTGIHLADVFNIQSGLDEGEAPTCNISKVGMDGIKVFLFYDFSFSTEYCPPKLLKPYGPDIWINF